MSNISGTAMRLKTMRSLSNASIAVATRSAGGETIRRSPRQKPTSRTLPASALSRRELRTLTSSIWKTP